MKCIVLLFYSAHYSTYSTRRWLILVYSHWFRNLIFCATCNSQCSLNCLMQNAKKNLKNQKIRLKKNLIFFRFFLNHDFFQPCDLLMSEMYHQSYLSQQQRVSHTNTKVQQMSQITSYCKHILAALMNFWWSPNVISGSGNELKIQHIHGWKKAGFF